MIVYSKLALGSNSIIVVGSSAEWFLLVFNPTSLQFGFFLPVSIITDRGLTGAWDLWKALQFKLLSIGCLILYVM